MKKLFVKFEAAQLSGASGFSVPVHNEHCSLGVDGVKLFEKSGEVFRGTDASGFNRGSVLATADGGAGGKLSISPTAANVGQVKSGKADGFAVVRFAEPIATVNDGSHRDFVATVIVSNPDAAPAMNLTIDSAFGQSFSEPSRSVDAVSASRPETFAIPFNAASVQFLAGNAASEINPLPVDGKNHVGFGEHFYLFTP